LEVDLVARTSKLLTVDINGDINDIIAAKQDDANSRFLDFKFVDGAQPINLNKHTVRLRAVKPDGHRVYNNGVITDGARGRAQVELTNQVLAAPGKVEAELTIYGDGEKEVLTSKTFHIVVLPNLFDEEAVASTNEFGAAVVLFQDVAELRGVIYEILRRVGASTDAPGKGTVFSWLSNLYNYVVYLDNNIDDLKARLTLGSNVAIYSTPGTRTWTKPNSVVTAVEVIVVGAGGGGAAAFDGGYGGFAGTAGTIKTATIDVSRLSSEIVTVGAPGTGGSGIGAVGTNGAASSFGSYLKGAGGKGGTGKAGTSYGQSGGDGYSSIKLAGDGHSSSSHSGGTGGEGYGAGGGGSAYNSSGSYGGNGAPGLVIIKY